MNKTSSLVILVNSLTKAEKRYFRLYANLQNGEKVYLFLFDLLDKKLSIEEIYSLFCKEQDGSSFDMAAKHLYRVILDCLIKLREKQNVQTEICNYISKAGVLFERALFDDSFVELEKAKKLAVAYENDPLLLLILRTEIKYLSALNFAGISERQLVAKQMKIQETMKYSRNVNMHLQLYDILKHRLVYKGYSRSDKQKEDLNDLVLSELNLIANSSYQGFEATKLHALFQATYYLNSGNYKSALRHYRELINLFEQNRHLLLNPPIYYVSAIQGVLDSLHTAGLYKEIPYFLSKLKELENKDYQVEFILDIRACVFYYELTCLINTGDFGAAKELAENQEEYLLKKCNLLEPETQLKLYTVITILYLCYGDMVNAKKKMKKIFGSGKLFHTLPSYKTARLVNLLLQAELGNYDFLLSEVNAIKRSISSEKHVYITEKLIFRFVQAYPLPSYEKMQNKLWAHFQKDINKIKQDKYERHLLKSFDFLSWIESKLSNRSFAEILEETADQKKKSML